MESSQELYDVFSAFALFGGGQHLKEPEMTSSTFSKLAKDTRLLDRQLSTTDLDLIFTKVSAKKKLSFETFQLALHHIAVHKSVSFDAVVSAVLAVEGVRINGTVAEPSRFHDDKSTYTGVHNHGGPSHVDRHHVTMEYQMDRSDGDVRGVKEYSYGAQGIPNAMAGESPRRVSGSGSGSGGRRELGARPGSSSGSGRAAPVPVRRESGPSYGRRESSSRRPSLPGAVEAGVSQAFYAFAGSVGKASFEIDSAKFFKLMKESGLISRAFGRTDCDLVFTKSVSAGGWVKRLPYSGFRDVAVPMIADHLVWPVQDVLQQVAELAGTLAAASGQQAAAARDASGRRRSSGSVAAGAAVIMPSPSRRESRGAPSARRSAESVGSVIAGSANKKGGVYDRLCDQRTYTGVYAARFNGGGGCINGDTANMESSASGGFRGGTNSGGDHIVRDISQICNRRW
ncbi:unnamed protein product [Chrysoparadoxa australica]